MDQALRQITDRIRAATADGTPLCIRGGGTKDFYGEPPRGEVLDTRPLAGITTLQITPRVASTTRESRLRSAWAVARPVGVICVTKSGTSGKWACKAAISGAAARVSPTETA